MIDKCRSCYSKNLQEIISLGDQYLSVFLDDDTKPGKYPLDLIMCKDCTLLQLKNTAPSLELYNDNYGYRSGINNTIQVNLSEIVREASKYVDLYSGDMVIDIGANDGTLLSNYPENLFKVGIEPVKKLSRDCKKYANLVINDFFNAGSLVEFLNPKQRAKIITAISCFYDLDDPNEFLGDIEKLLDEDGVFIIQQNYLVGMLSQNAFDNIVHEHLEYYSLSSLKNLLEKHNLEIFDVSLNDINGGSFRTAIAFKGQKEITPSVEILSMAETMLNLSDPETYLAFAERIKAVARELKTFISGEVKKGKKVYTYGASTRGNTLLQFAGLDNTLITAAVERNPEKFGKKIASLNIPIISEEQAREENPDYMLVLPWFFKAEFLAREKTYLDSGGSFIFPLPTVKVIGGGD